MPSADQQLRRRLNQPMTGQLAPNVSQALRVLSLRIPNVLGGRPIAPDDLLKAHVGGSGGGPNAVVSSLLRAGAATPQPSGVSEGASATNTVNLNSPTWQPFAVSSGRSESGALAGLTNDALSGGSLGTSWKYGGNPGEYGDGSRPTIEEPTTPPTITPTGPDYTSAPSGIEGLASLLSDYLNGRLVDRRTA